MEEHELKEECLEDLNTAIDIISNSKHPQAQRIIRSLETINDFCERWWET